MDDTAAGAEAEVRRVRDRRTAEEWALVLAAVDVPSTVRYRDGEYALFVGADDAARAGRALLAYERENPPRPPPEKPPPHSATALNAAIASCGALLVFFAAVTGPRDPATVWFERGSSDAERVLAGETWRVVTALTLHADAAHVLANALSGALFLTALGNAVGPGLALALALLAGAGGNLTNAVYHGALHSSVGASTAIFGAVGLLGGLGVARQRRGGARGHRSWAPLAASLALLAMLGTSERADLGAHVFGLAVGGVLGVPVGLAVPRPPGAATQLAAAALAILAVLYGWGLALGW